MTGTVLTTSVRLDCHLGSDDGRSLAEDALDGLTRPFKELPPKYFYDSRGSELFEQICVLPEYYPTRTEHAILATKAHEIVRRTGVGDLVELGSGFATKTRVLLDAMSQAGTLTRYVPFDVSEDTVWACGEQLGRDYPGLLVHGIVGDFERHLDTIPAAEPPRIVAFLGGTLGNFLPGSRRRFLRTLADLLRPEDHLLLGIDLVKEPSTLEAAYNDNAGVTAEFNRNVLAVLNRELGADFDLDLFEHVAFYDRAHEWIEMRLRARRSCSVAVPALDLRVEFGAREEMRTEISAKFTVTRLRRDLAAAGLELETTYSDADRLFGLTLCRRPPRPPLSDATPR